MLICKVAVIASAGLAALAGCSFVLVDKPPPDHASHRYFDCTSSNFAPAVDATLGGLLGVGVLGSISDGTTDSRGIVAGAVVVGAALASATYGFLQASHCRDAKLALAERLLEPPHPASPSPPPPLFPSPRGAAPSPPLSRDPWLAEGAPPGEGNWRADENPAPPPAPPAPPPPSEQASSQDAGVADR